MTAAEDDIGLAAERTTLAWQRTALAYGVTGAVALRVVPGLVSRITVTAGLLVAAGVAGAASRRVTREGRHRRGWLRALAIGTVVAAVLGVASGVLPLDPS